MALAIEVRMTVNQRFNAFLSNLRLTETQIKDGQTKHKGVRACLNRAYYNSNSESANSFLVGSWGKDTQIRPPRDIDVMFVLPYEVYQRFEKVPYWRNKQSELLQEVKRHLKGTYPDTALRADGQVIKVPFYTYAVEVVPSFLLQGGQYYICDTNGGGSYKRTDPTAEINAVQNSNRSSLGNTRDLIRMLKVWQEFCNVPLKSFWLELLAIEFLGTWQYCGKSTVYYDWMLRDFFRWLDKKGAGYSYVIVPGTQEYIWIGNDWASKALSARWRADKACEFESNEMPWSAGAEWKKIFGELMPAGEV